MNITISLIYNLSLLVAISIVSSFVNVRWSYKTIPGSVFQGLIFGFAAVVGILQPFVLAPGLIFDGRSAVISLSSLFFGPVAGAISASMAVVARLHVGGPGTLMGLSVILESALIGIFFYYRWKKRNKKITVVQLLGFSLLVHAVMLALTVTLPKGVIIETIRTIAFPVLVIYPAASLLIGKILMVQESLQRSLEETRTARHQAEQANRLKDAFISNISHEIRTPLNAILGFSNLLETEEPSKYTPEERGFFEKISQSGNRLMRTVDLIINFSRLQVGDFRVTIKKIDVPELIHSLVDEVRALSGKRLTTITFENRSGPVEVQSDNLCLSHSIAQLLDNALKYSQAGKVDITLARDSQLRVCVEIRDNGTGIPPEKMKTLFEPYTTGETGLTRIYGGVGLGLSLTKKMLDEIGALLHVESEVGKGSAFTIILPAEQA